MRSCDFSLGGCNMVTSGSALGLGDGVSSVEVGGHFGRGGRFCWQEASLVATPRDRLAGWPRLAFDSRWLQPIRNSSIIVSRCATLSSFMEALSRRGRPSRRRPPTSRISVSREMSPNVAGPVRRQRLRALSKIERSRKQNFNRYCKITKLQIP